MDGFRYRYSAATPLRSATGTTTLSSTNPCSARKFGSCALLKSTMDATPPGRSTLHSSLRAVGMSDTFRSPYPMVAPSHSPVP